jgi:energy-coupling factor transporter ATP-binding protein EcfA2
MAYYKHYGYLLKDPDIFEVFFPGIARSTKDNKQNDVILICGRKGVGKTQLAKFMAYIYHNVFPKNRVIVFCGIKDLYNDLPWAIKVDLDEVAEEESEKPKSDFSGIPDSSEFGDSLVIFDDTERHPNPKIEKMLYQLVNVLAQNGRNFNTCIIAILHQINKGLTSTTLLREADSIVIFPRAYDMNTFNTLVRHFGFDKEEARQIYQNREEWFILIHHTHPSYIYLGTSMEKIET